MSKKRYNIMSDDKSKYSDKTKQAILGRDSKNFHGFVNPPVYRGSTVLFDDITDFHDPNSKSYRYGRYGSPITDLFCDAISELEGSYKALLTPSGTSAIACVLMAFSKKGSHLLITDSAYEPTRDFADNFLIPFGVDVEYYDPLISSDIKKLLRKNTSAILTEIPGSLTMEMQDIKAITKECRAFDKDITIITDNCWGALINFKPYEHDIDVTIHSATKYINGHSDVLLGIVSSNEKHFKRLHKIHKLHGLTAGPDDVYLALRGLRTLSVRIKHQQKSAVIIAKWLQKRPEIEKVLYPALKSDPGYNLWKKDFKGASALFSIILKNHYTKESIYEFVDSLNLLKIGYSWGGFESLILPFDPTNIRSATKWNEKGEAFRIHIGVESIKDIKKDFAEAFKKLKLK